MPAVASVDQDCSCLVTPRRCSRMAGDDSRPRAAPPRTLLTSSYGYLCDPGRPPRADGKEPPLHTGCAGWWPLPDADHDGWRCACSCHELEYGWPGYHDRH